METEKIIHTKIPINDIINDTINKNPKLECDFNNLLIYNTVNLFLDKLNVQLEASHQMENHIPQIAGRKSKKNNKNKLKKQSRVKRHKKTRKIKKIKGGADPRIVLFLLGIFLTFVHGIKNMTHNDVTNRLKDSMKVVDIFKNYYGTCAVNTLLFLNTIDLPTFEELSIQVMETNSGMTRNQMSSYLNKELNIETKWYMFTGSGEDDVEKGINNFIEKIRKKMISMRDSYGFSQQQDILTALNYPSKRGSYHAVVVWLTNKNEIVIIDPQRFYVENKIILYTSEAYLDRYMDNDKQLFMSPIQTYLRERVDVISDWKDTELLLSLHIEIEDIKGRDRLSPFNQNLLKTIGRIRDEEQKIIDRKRIEF
jgi:hypothetical protein